MDLSVGGSFVFVFFVCMFVCLFSIHAHLQCSIAHAWFNPRLAESVAVELWTERATLKLSVDFRLWGR